jgi:hypothetical protein
MLDDRLLVDYGEIRRAIAALSGDASGLRILHARAGHNRVGTELLLLIAANFAHPFGMVHS